MQLDPQCESLDTEYFSFLTLKATSGVEQTLHDSRKRALNKCVDGDVHNVVPCLLIATVPHIGSHRNVIVTYSAQ